MKFITSGPELVIVLERREQFAALRAKITITRQEVENARWVEKFDEWRRWEVRLPGASIPGRILAGSYWTEEGWDFLYIIRPIGIRHTVATDVICLELKDHEKYRRVIISAEKSDYDHIAKWLKVPKMPKGIPKKEAPKTRKKKK